MTRAAIAGGALATVLVVLALAVRHPALERDDERIDFDPPPAMYPLPGPGVGS
ncbi:MAG: hypothetical protein ACYC6F_12360 [Longimicrobiales bacterium]